MANQKIGNIQCPFCLSLAEVRLNVSRKKYIYCPVDKQINCGGQGYSDYIDDKMQPCADVSPDETTNPAAPIPAPAVLKETNDEVAPAPAPKKTEKKKEKQKAESWMPLL